MSQLYATRIMDYEERPASCRLLCLHALRKASKVVEVEFVKLDCVGTLPRLGESLYLLQEIIDSVLLYPLKVCPTNASSAKRVMLRGCSLCEAFLPLAPFSVSLSLLLRASVCPNMCHTPI